MRETLAPLYLLGQGQGLGLYKRPILNPHLGAQGMVRMKKVNCQITPLSRDQWRCKSYKRDVTEFESSGCGNLS
uniref:Uncharacterized protein n=1 Tax=Steinernema glaseri TaxID=37863 RepID=A0A1I7ZBX3_9BILA